MKKKFLLMCEDCGKGTAELTAKILKQYIESNIVLRDVSITELPQEESGWCACVKPKTGYYGCDICVCGKPVKTKQEESKPKIEKLTKYDYCIGNVVDKVNEIITLLGER